MSRQQRNAQPNILVSMYQWKRKGRIWIAQLDESKAKVADRPHWITVAGTLITLFISVGTAIVGVKALNTSSEALKVSNRAAMISEQNMKSGQRSYLRLEHGKLHIGAPGEMPPNIRGHIPPNSPNRPFVLLYEFDVINSGNTPAMLGGSEVKLARGGWGSKVDDGRLIQGSMWVDAKGSSHVKGFSHQRLMDDASEKSFSGVLKDKSFYFEGFLDYKDIFGESHKLTWCWVYGNPMDAPMDCPIGANPGPTIWFPFPASEREKKELEELSQMVHQEMKKSKEAARKKEQEKR